MGLPAKRRTKQSKRERASHFALATYTLVRCGHCHRPIRPHLVCPHCGYYRGRQVLQITSKVERRAAKKKRDRGDKGARDQDDKSKEK